MDVDYVTYTVSVVTGQDKKAGTDANVTIQLFGELGSSPVKKLNKSLVKGDKFESGRTDVFELAKMVDLGESESGTSCCVSFCSQKERKESKTRAEEVVLFLLGRSFNHVRASGVVARSVSTMPD